MDHFNYRNDEVHCEDIPLTLVARQVGTPTFVYSKATLIQHLQKIKKAFEHYPTLPCFAVKSNGNLSILKEVFAQGFGADIVSLGELKRALKAGVNPQNVVYSGVGKKRHEIAEALEAGIFSINIESAFELELIRQVTSELKKTARVAMRVNPNIDAKTHPKITTGLFSSKFGLNEEEALRLAGVIKDSPFIQLVGIACHIGSQITSLSPLRDAVKKMVELSQTLIQNGHRLEALNMGGGLGIRYSNEEPPAVDDYAEILVNEVRKTGLKLVIEPGRSVIGNTGVLLTEVIGVKKTPHKSFMVIDAAMNDLIRPSLYNSYHDIQPVMKKNAPLDVYDVVGPICESGDYLGLGRALPPLAGGDLVVIKSAGAYGSSMSSNYNSRPRSAEVMIDGTDIKIIKKREEFENLWSHEI
jgi:diaminopimelate decarboxylase